MFPSMKLVVQDRAQIIDQARSFWEREQPDALEKGRVQLIPHDFFKENPIKGADAYILRYILLVYTALCPSKRLTVITSLGMTGETSAASTSSVPSAQCSVRTRAY